MSASMGYAYLLREDQVDTFYTEYTKLKLSIPLKTSDKTSEEGSKKCSELDLVETEKPKGAYTLGIRRVCVLNPNREVGSLFGDRPTPATGSSKTTETSSNETGSFVSERSTSSASKRPKSSSRGGNKRAGYDPAWRMSGPVYCRISNIPLGSSLRGNVIHSSGFTGEDGNVIPALLCDVEHIVKTHIIDGQRYFQPMKVFCPSNRRARRTCGEVIPGVPNVYGDAPSNAYWNNDDNNDLPRDVVLYTDESCRSEIRFPYSKIKESPTQVPPQMTAQMATRALSSSQSSAQDSIRASPQAHTQSAIQTSAQASTRPVNQVSTGLLTPPKSPEEPSKRRRASDSSANTPRQSKTKRRKRNQTARASKHTTGVSNSNNLSGAPVGGKRKRKVSPTEGQEPASDKIILYLRVPTKAELEESAEEKVILRLRVPTKAELEQSAKDKVILHLKGPSKAGAKESTQGKNILRLKGYPLATVDPAQGPTADPNPADTERVLTKTTSVGSKKRKASQTEVKEPAPKRNMLYLKRYHPNTVESTPSSVANPARLVMSNPPNSPVSPENEKAKGKAQDEGGPDDPKSPYSPTFLAALSPQELAKQRSSSPKSIDAKSDDSPQSRTVPPSVLLPNFNDEDSKRPRTYEYKPEDWNDVLGRHTLIHPENHECWVPEGVETRDAVGVLRFPKLKESGERYFKTFSQLSRNKWWIWDPKKEFFFDGVFLKSRLDPDFSYHLEELGPPTAITNRKVYDRYDFY
ncbi:hypothetical protein TWF481_002091 [Arthrobotrys musiformis]|uniref:Uncharacterized protein n=1 Tax=Arthrobotrys musiformis TaxID=47236 RepID=A0AAV9VTF6_9PEZI